MRCGVLCTITCEEVVLLLWCCLHFPMQRLFIWGCIGAGWRGEERLLQFDSVTRIGSTTLVITACAGIDSVLFGTEFTPVALFA